VYMCSAKNRGVGTPFPHQIKLKIEPNSSNKGSIRLHEFHIGSSCFTVD